MKVGKYDDPKDALADGLAIGMYRVTRDDILWRLPGMEAGATFRGIATERTCPHEVCGWFFVAKPEDVTAHERAQIPGEHP